MLVWLGIFNEIIWFRFDAGHSHTELADRFFSMLKKHFCSTGAERASKMESFEVLEEKLLETFTNSAETVELDYLFANWDFNEWFSSGGLVANKNFGNITFDNVFRYKYDEACWQHGSVQFTYKDHLARKGNGIDCEWSPFTNVTSAKGKERSVTNELGRCSLRTLQICFVPSQRESPIRMVRLDRMAHVLRRFLPPKK
jgi:hypothetical protein